MTTTGLKLPFTAAFTLMLLTCLSFSTTSASEKRREKIKDLREDFLAGSDNIRPEDFNERDQWICKNYHIAFEKDVYKVKSTFNEYRGDLLHKINGSKWPFGHFYFRKGDNDHWFFPGVQGPIYARSLAPNKVIIEVNMTERYAGIFFQVVCKNSTKNCLMQRSSIDQEYFLSQYKLCER